MKSKRPKKIDNELHKVKSNYCLFAYGEKKGNKKIPAKLSLRWNKPTEAEIKAFESEIKNNPNFKGHKFKTVLLKGYRNMKKALGIINNN